MQPHRAFLSLAVLVPFLALPALTIAAPLAGATRGVTDGEPATAEAHCCGMKGLGGAKVDVMCHPGTVAMGKPFTVNVNFTSDIKRPVDVHVDVLNAQTKTYYAGKWEEFDTQAGMASLTIKMPDTGVTEPFLWKVFVTPRGEPFPNMLAETGFVSRKFGGKGGREGGREGGCGSLSVDVDACLYVSFFNFILSLSLSAFLNYSLTFYSPLPTSLAPSPLPQTWPTACKTTARASSPTASTPPR